MVTRRQGWLYALAATVIYSTNAPIARGAILAGLDPNTLVFARFVVGALLLAVTLLLTSVGQPRGEQRPFDQRGFWFCLAAGVLNSLMMLTAAWGLTWLNASIATLLSIALTPLFIFGLLRLAGERGTTRDYVRLGIGLAGLYFLVGISGSASGWGIFLTAVSALLYSLHMVMVQWYLRTYNTWVITALLVATAMIPAALLWQLMGASLYVPGSVGWLAILVQGVAATYIARILIYTAINEIGSAQIALLTPLEAGLTVVWSMLALHETVFASQWVGIGLILLSAALVGRVRGGLAQKPSR